MDFDHLGRNIRHFRRLRNLTQSELAQRVRPTLGQADISKLERGLRPSDPSHVVQLAQALGVPAAALLRRPRVITRADATRPVVLRESA